MSILFLSLHFKIIFRPVEPEGVDIEGAPHAPFEMGSRVGRDKFVVDMEDQVSK